MFSEMSINRFKSEIRKPRRIDMKMTLDVTTVALMSILNLICQWHHSSMNISEIDTFDKWLIRTFSENDHQ